MSADTLPLDLQDPTQGRPPGADTLLYVAGASESNTQWRAEQMQLVRWGGFDGVTTVDLHPGATLLSGASGTGKSTLLDAYTALMMPTEVPFNGASNAASGRSRGPGQRSLVSYLRGQTDTTSGHDGDEEAEVLRGKATSTWGGVAVTFVNDHGAAFTAARLFWVPVSARMDGEVQRRLLTFDGRLALRDFEQYSADAFAPAKLRAHTPGLIVHNTYQEFSARLFTRLGIGANGDGDKALQLLALVQSGPQIRTVDALYKDMVLERPGTYAAADQALEHFDALADTYRRMQDEHRKLQILGPITETHQRLLDARATIERVDAFGVNVTGPSPLTLWSARREAAMLEQAAQTARTEHTDAARHAGAAEREHQRLDGDLRTVREEHTRAGGGDLHALTTQLQNAQQEAAGRQLALDALVGHLGAVLPDGADLSDPDVFDALVATGREELAAHPDRHGALAAQLEALGRRRWELDDALRQTRQERDDLAGRTSRVPSALLRLREQVCQVTGMAEEELPFLAELVDVPEEHEQWRTAIETVLAGPARRMLVPADRFEEFSAAIDPLRIRGRVLHFDAATAGLPDAAPAPAHTVAGKVVVKDGPFRGWVTQVLADRNATCVASTAELRGPGLRVTAAGQLRRDRSGSHGRADERNILGFSNTDLVEELTARLRVLGGERDALQSEHDDLTRQQKALAERRDAFLRLSGVPFTTIDVRDAARHVAELSTARERILTGNDVLAELQARMEDLQRQITAGHKEAVLLADRAETLQRRWSDLEQRKDAVMDIVIDLEDRQQVLLTDQQTAALEEHLRAAVGQGDPDDLGQWGTHLAHLRTRLLGAQDRARTEEARARADLERTFAVYLDAFEAPNLVPTLACYPDFAAILAEVQAVGLHARREEWRKRVMDWSGQDLVPLAQAMQTSLDEIDARLTPINAILAQLPFGAGQDRLEMRMRPLHRDQVLAFRRQLRKLSSGATQTLDDTQMQARFKELEAFLAQLRSPKDPRHDARSSVRDDLLDVRRHVAIRAERRSADGQLLSTYTSLGSKSGGETQELIAFIVGAALRYRLGDEERARPRFAPVFLDEGFIKADAEFASRAVRAWTGLGFQLVVGAPLDKVAALEPHMDAFVLVTKNQTTKRSRVRLITDAERSEVRRHGTDR